MNTVNAHWLFLVNHTKLQRISYIKQKYLTEITGSLINQQINNSVTNCYQQNLEKPRLSNQRHFQDTPPTSRTIKHIITSTNLKNYHKDTNETGDKQPN